jgi:hypothetical protein
MGKVPDDKKPSGDRGDSFTLDFGKNTFRVDEKVAAEKDKPGRPKLPPQPGPVPAAQSVPLLEVLNRSQLRKKK